MGAHIQSSFRYFLNDICYKISNLKNTHYQGRRKGGRRGGGSPPLPILKGGRGGGEAKVPFYRIYLFKNEQALAEVIICVKAESGVIARTKILRLYLL